MTEPKRGKKLFIRLIKRASQPFPKEADRQRQPQNDDYSEKKTRQRKTVGISVKRRGKSR